MNFTREPIIETVITPKEGYKLLVKSSKGGDEEEYLVEAVEIVVFGKAYFFRSKERINPFLLPVGDYNIFETREMRMALKNASMEKPIKIEVAPNVNKEREDHSSERRKKKKRKNFENNKPIQEEPVLKSIEPSVEEVVLEKMEEPTPTMFKKLIPPPSTLIKEKLSQSNKERGFEEALFPEEVEQEEMVFDEHELFPPPEEEAQPNGESIP